MTHVLRGEAQTSIHSFLIVIVTRHPLRRVHSPHFTVAPLDSLIFLIFIIFSSTEKTWSLQWMEAFR